MRNCEANLNPNTCRQGRQTYSAKLRPQEAVRRSFDDMADEIRSRALGLRSSTEVDVVSYEIYLDAKKGFVLHFSSDFCVQ